MNDARKARTPETKPRRGFGSIRKLPSKRFQAYYADPEGRTVVSRTGNVNPLTHTAPVTFDSKGDAEAWLVDERRLISAGTWTSPGERSAAATEAEQRREAMNFRRYAGRWVQERRNSKGEHLAPSTHDKYSVLLRHHIFGTFGDKALDAITREDVRNWYDSPGFDAIPAQRAHAYNLLRAILNSAEKEDELIAKNPCYIRGAGMRHRTKDVRPASPEDLTAIVATMPDRQRLLILLAAWCALRGGELRELRRSDVSLSVDPDGEDIGWIRVRRGVVNVKNRAADDLHDEAFEETQDEALRRTVSHVKAPKTSAGIRDVAIPPFLVPTVRHHLKTHTGPSTDALLFTGRAGSHLALSSIFGRATTFDPNGAVKKAGWGFREARRLIGREDLTIHDLRHTAASMAGEEGASLAELMHRLGHSTPSMALLYQHSSRNRDLDLARRLSDRAISTGSVDSKPIVPAASSELAVDRP